MHLPNAIDAKGISVISVDGTDPEQVADSIPRDLAGLRGIAGVHAAADVNTMPLSRSGFGTAVYPTAARKSSKYVTQYLMTTGGEKAFGLHLLRGRFFTKQEYAGSGLSSGYVSTGHVAIVTRSFAHKLWPGQSAVGKVLYAIDDNSYTVVGVVADVLAPRLSSSKERGNDDNVFFPVKPVANLDTYILRSAPGQRQDVLRRAEKVLTQLEPGAVIKGQTYTKMRATYFANATSMIWILVLVCIVMLGVTAFGIVGLTSFWVTQRRAQIGIRRALGARQRDILQLLPDREFPAGDSGCGAGHGAGLDHQPLSHAATTSWRACPGCTCRWAPWPCG